jgi:DNA-binding beta-propeller fold protein YncE
MMMDFDRGTATFQMQGRPVGGEAPATATAAYETGARIAALANGAALVIDADSGKLVRTDSSGKNAAHQLAIGTNPGLLAYDPIDRLAYVADRGGNRIAIVKVGDKLERAGEIATPAEPYGVALSPDRKTLLVTAIADRVLVAYDVADAGKERWRHTLGREPRGVAISGDGKRVLVAYLTTGTVDLFAGDDVEHVALATAAPTQVRTCLKCVSRPDALAESFARAAFAVTFLGDHQAVVPFQRETPIQIQGAAERTGSYGGGFEPPVRTELAFLAMAPDRTRQATATIGPNQPRALAWDGTRDALYIAGIGNDSIIQIRNASQVGVAAGTVASTTVNRTQCGPDGLAVDSSGNVLVWCAFTRSVERVEFVDAHGQLAAAAKVDPGRALVASSLDIKQHEGMVLFHSADSRVSMRGALACASCHPDGRADGLSWRIEKHELQTPLLVGRLKDTHPFKWDGTDPDLRASMKSTMKRLGGAGLDKYETDALAAYLEQLPAPRTPTRDAAQVARGQKLFDSGDLGCRSCHGGPKYTDQDRHKLAGSNLPEAKTPSLIGLAASAPYFHDGSAATLEALLRDRGAVHGMAETAKLSDQQVADLAAFLETL